MNRESAEELTRRLNDLIDAEMLETCHQIGKLMARKDKLVSLINSLAKTQELDALLADFIKTAIS